MKEIILQRIAEIKVYENGFKPTTMRWHTFKLGETHISEVDFKSLSDDELVSVFETIVKRYYRQM